MHINCWASGFFGGRKDSTVLSSGDGLPLFYEYYRGLLSQKKNVSTVPSNMFHRFMVRWKAKRLLIFNRTVINYAM